jgi:hypothetical protein
MNLINNKKGENDLIQIVITLFIVSFLGLIVLLIIGKVTPIFQSTVENNSIAYLSMEKSQDIFEGGLDSLFVGILIILLIGMIMLAFFISSSPIFIPIYLIISVIAVWFSAIISNAYVSVEGTGIFDSVLGFLPMQTFIMEKLPYFISGFAFILLVITYSKDIFQQRQEY